MKRINVRRVFRLNVEEIDRDASRIEVKKQSDLNRSRSCVNNFFFLNMKR